jgi:hypothetical protein
MSILLSYAPWLVFLAVTGATDWRLGLATGLAAQVVVLLTATPRRLGVLDAGMLVFFAGFGAYSLVAPHSGLEPSLTNVSMVWMTLLAGASILVGRPFTLTYSEGDVPPEVASSALFVAINRTIAWAWTGAFAALAVIGFATHALDRGGWGTMASVVVIVAAITFTKRYPDRAVAAAQVTPSTPSTPALTS